MSNKTLSESLRSSIRPLADRFGIGGIMRQAFVEARLVGEYSKFALRGRPDPSTAIILAGSGRSGTTWLEEILCGLPGIQPIFEPLHPRFNLEVRRLTGIETRQLENQEAFLHAWYLAPDDEQPAWTALLENVLSGRLRNHWTDQERRTYFPDRYLVKEIRANLMLGYIYNSTFVQI